MWDFIVGHWCLIPYLALLFFLAVMSIREKTPRKRAAMQANPGGAEFLRTVHYFAAPLAENHLGR